MSEKREKLAFNLLNDKNVALAKDKLLTKNGYGKVRLNKKLNFSYLQEFKENWTWKQSRGITAYAFECIG
jgi:hypothetical protein